MPTSTYEPIATVTTTSDSAKIRISSIPSTYTDLVVVAHIGNVLDTAGTVFTINDSTANIYSSSAGYGNGLGTTSAWRSNNDTDGRLLTAGVAFSPYVENSVILHFFDYANTTTFKQAMVFGGAPRAGGTPGVSMTATSIKTTSAITSVELLNGTSYLAGTQMTVYGIKAT